MDEQLEQQLAQRMTELPADIQSAIQSADLSEKVQAIGKKYQLHIDQIGQLETEIMLVMLGFSEPAELMSNIMNDLNVPEAIANLIATDVSDEIFMPIRESMQKFMEERAAKVDSSKPAVTPTTIPPNPVVPVSTPTIVPAEPVPATPKQPEPQFVGADVALTQKTVTPPVPIALSQSAAPQPPAQPKSYSTDPYHEPIE